MRSINICLLLLTLSSSVALSQELYNNKWCFGYHDGLDFSVDPPVQFTDSINTIEGCSTVCDATGNLLFYSDGNQVYNKNNQVMPNGAGILGNGPAVVGPGSATQGVAIVQCVGNRSLYYLFVLDAYEQDPGPQGGKLRYSVVDMSLNNGLGDVADTLKNIIIGDSLSEKMTVIAGDGCFYWLMVHAADTSQYKVYKIDINGIATTPVISNTGVIISAPSFSSPYISGDMKVSPNDSLIALVSTETPQVEVAQFDHSTGIVTNAIKIDSNSNFFNYGVAFSPDSKRLYIGSYSGLYQYNLALLPDTTAVKNSKTIITANPTDDMRIGSDNKIYTISDESANLYCINDPNALGVACNITYLSSLPATIYTIYPHSFGNPIIVNPADTIIANIDTAVCFAVPFTMVAPAGYYTYLWSDGQTTQTDTFTHPSVKWVTAYGGCNFFLTDTFHVNRVEDTNCNLGIIPLAEKYKTIAVIPNPAYDGTFHFPPLSNERQYTINIYNSIGEKVIATPYRHIISLSDYARGLYFYVVTGNGAFYKGKLLYE